MTLQYSDSATNRDRLPSMGRRPTSLTWSNDARH